MPKKVPAAPRRRRTATAVVAALSLPATRGAVRLGGLHLPCALGRSGRRARKREGDGATPVGCFRAVNVLYRADRIPRPLTGLPIRPIGHADGWCDAPGDRNYNRPVRMPYAASAECLWRADPLYDLVVVLAYNIRPRVRGRGSAIFAHVARPDLAPTEGCIALGRQHLILLLRHLRAGARLRILP